MSDTKNSKPVTRRALLGGAAVVTAGAGAGAAWAVDRFLIEKVQISDVAAYEASQGVTTSASATTSSTAQAKLTENSYSNGRYTLTLNKATQGSGNDIVTYYVADLKLTDTTALASAFANNQFGQNIVQNTSEIAAAHDGIWAINGDYYGFRDTGITIRNGAVFRDSPAREGLAIYRDGTMKIYDEKQTDAQALINAGVLHTLSFGPGIVNDGKVIDGIDQVEIDTNFGNHSIQGNQPRTGVGMVDTNHFLFVVIDGRSTGYSRGMTLPEMAQLFVDLGAKVAYNLDGGGSSVMYFNGALYSNPLGKSKERETSDILYLAK